MTRPRVQQREPQRGVAALMMAGLLVVLLGALGLGIDLGRLYVTRAELQTAADACALAAAGELGCTDGTCLATARTQGQAAAARNKAELQSTTVSIASADITFAAALDGTYGESAPNAPTHVRCTARRNGVGAGLLGLMGIGASNVSASAVANRTGTAVGPIGICDKSPAWATGDWVVATNSTGNVRWVSLDGSTGAAQIKDQLAGSGTVTLSIGDTVNAPNANFNAVKDGYNTRFGIYPKTGSTYNATNSPPDATGVGWPKSAPWTATSWFTQYQNARTAGTPFSLTGYPTGANANTSMWRDGFATSKYQAAATLPNSYRRLLRVPRLNCSVSPPTVTGFACALLLNPIDTRAGATGTDSMIIEYRASTDCPTIGGAGSPGLGTRLSQ